jgi:hypothetical protein
MPTQNNTGNLTYLECILQNVADTVAKTFLTMWVVLEKVELIVTHLEGTTHIVLEISSLPPDEMPSAKSATPFSGLASSPKTAFHKK